MTKVTIDRELLERIETWVTDDCEALRELQAILAAPRQPEGEGLEVVGFASECGLVVLRGLPITGAVQIKASAHKVYDVPLCRLSDHLRAIAELREECKIQRNSLAGARNQLRANRLETERLAVDWLAAVAERDTLRQQLAERDAQIASMRAEVTPFIETHWRPVARQRDKLADLLDEVKSDLSAAMNWGDLDRIAVRIDAALAEVNK